MGTEIKRKLASIQRIEEVRDIEGADSIQAYRVLGWWVVDRKNVYNVGDFVVYLSIDSWVPHELAPFLSKGQEPREYNGVKGERLRTIKLRGQVSQGLLYPVGERDYTSYVMKPNGQLITVYEGSDVTEFLGIQKWEAPIPTQLQGKIRGNFPSWARKTDQERCQTIWNDIQKHIENDTQFEVSIKLDGSSASYGYSPEDEYVVCSRNLSLDINQEGNTFVDTGRLYQLEEKLHLLGRPLMISGELCGPGIQKNQEKLKAHQLFVFDIYDPMTGSYVSTDERMKLVKELGLDHVPVLHKNVTFKELGLYSLEKLLAFAEGPSLNKDAQREGVVFKSIDGSFSFKVISNKWLLKNDG